MYDIIEHYACRVDGKSKGGKISLANIFPRYHQLNATRNLLADVRQNGAGQQYLIRHSADSGKSNTISWLARQLTNMRRADGRHAFDAVVIVADHCNQDKQINGNLRKLSRMGNILHANRGANWERL